MTNAFHGNIFLFVSPVSQDLQNWCINSSLRDSKIQQSGYQSPIICDLTFQLLPKVSNMWYFYLYSLSLLYILLLLFWISFFKLRNNIVKSIDFKCTAQQIFICVHITHIYDQTKIWSTLSCFFFFLRKHVISTTVSSKSCFDVLVKLFLIPIKRTNCKLWMLLFHQKASCVAVGIVISFTYSSVWNLLSTYCVKALF